METAELLKGIIVTLLDRSPETKLRRKHY